MNLKGIEKSYKVHKLGGTEGVNEWTDFDRTANTYGMDAWVLVGDDPESGFTRPAAAP